MPSDARKEREVDAVPAPGEIPGGFAGEEDVQAGLLKEAFGLPDVLPPMRLPAEAELAAQARVASLPARLAALVAWAGKNGRKVTVDEELTEADAAEACGEIGAAPGEMAFLWRYAVAVEWLKVDDAAWLAVPGETARDWLGGDDQGVLDAWASTFAAVISETLDAASPGADGHLDFRGPAAALAMALFIVRQGGIPVSEAGEMIMEGAVGELPTDRAMKARDAWIAAHGNPAALLLEWLRRLGAAMPPEEGAEEDTIRLSPLGTSTMREQLIEAGVEVPLLPSPEEMTAGDLLALADGTSPEELDDESAAWLAIRGPEAGAREILGLAITAGAGERMVAVSVATEAGAAAEPAWREHLLTPELRGYAKIALSRLAGGAPGVTVLPGLEPVPEDIAWMASDALAVVAEDAEFLEEYEVAARIGETIPPGHEAELFDLMSRGSHPNAVEILTLVGAHHPDKRVAKEARRSAYRASSRRATLR